MRILPVHFRYPRNYGLENGHHEHRYKDPDPDFSSEGLQVSIEWLLLMRSLVGEDTDTQLHEGNREVHGGFSSLCDGQVANSHVSILKSSGNLKFLIK